MLPYWHNNDDNKEHNIQQRRPIRLGFLVWDDRPTPFSVAGESCQDLPDPELSIGDISLTHQNVDGMYYNRSYMCYRTGRYNLLPHRPAASFRRKISCISAVKLGELLQTATACVTNSYCQLICFICQQTCVKSGISLKSTCIEHAHDWRVY